jgi:hypothetical protein
MNRYIIKNKGYNNNSGINFINCGMNQMKKNENKQVNQGDTAIFENVKREKYLDKSMNENYNIDESTKMTKEDRKVRRDLEIKADPNVGTGLFRIDEVEKNPMKIQNKVATTNFKADESMNKNIRLL